MQLMENWCHQIIQNTLLKSCTYSFVLQKTTRHSKWRCSSDLSACQVNKALLLWFKEKKMHAGTYRGHHSRWHTYSKQSGQLKLKLDACSCRYWKYLTSDDKGLPLWGDEARKLPIQSFRFQSDRICSTSSEMVEPYQLWGRLKWEILVK
jgi:hypothetical protein